MCQTPAGFNNQFIWLKQGQEEGCWRGGQPAEVNGELLNFIILSCMLSTMTYDIF